MSYQVIVKQSETDRVWDAIRDTEKQALHQVGLYMAGDTDPAVAYAGRSICNRLSANWSVSTIKENIFDNFGFEMHSKYYETGDVVAEPVVMNMDVCPVHGDVLGEGDICGTCERLGDALIAHIDKRIAVMTGTLYVSVKDSELSFRVPVYSFNDAKHIYFTVLNPLHVGKCYLAYTDDDGLEAKYVFQ